MINVTPPDWTLSPANLSKTIGLNGENGSVGTLTVTNSKGQNYSFSVTMTGNGSGYIKTDKTSFNLSAFSSTYVYVYHNTTGAYNPGYWFANVSIANLNGAFPANSNASVNLNVINLTLLIASPNETIPSLPVNASQRINITVNATLSGVPVTSDMAWTVSVGGQACGDVQSCFNCSGTSFWEINCTAPTIAGNIIYNDLAVTGNYTSMEGTIVSDTEASAIRYDDITPPQPHSVTVTPANYYSNISYIIINATITDNTLVNSSWLVITQPNGTDVTLFGTNLSSVYTFNFSSPNLLGDYDVYVYANDSQGYANSTMGWFDVYRPFQMSGTLANPNSANLSANFTLYRNGSSTVIHQFSTNTSQGWYNLSGHDRIYDVVIASFGHVARLYSVNTTASAISQHGSQAFNLTGAFRLDDFPNRTSQDISNFDLPNTAS
jgi:hypothetical protein